MHTVWRGKPRYKVLLSINYLGVHEVLAAADFEALQIRRQTCITNRLFSVGPQGKDVRRVGDRTGWFSAQRRLCKTTKQCLKGDTIYGRFSLDSTPFENDIHCCGDRGFVSHVRLVV